MKTSRHSRAAVVSATVVVLATVAASAAWASSDHCGAVAGGGAICQGNQTSSITVQNLTSASVSASGGVQDPHEVRTESVRNIPRACGRRPSNRQERRAATSLRLKGADCRSQILSS